MAAAAFGGETMGAAVNTTASAPAKAMSRVVVFVIRVVISTYRLSRSVRGPKAAGFAVGLARPALARLLAGCLPSRLRRRRTRAGQEARSSLFCRQPVDWECSVKIVADVNT